MERESRSSIYKSLEGRGDISWVDILIWGQEVTGNLKGVGNVNRKTGKY